MNNTLIISIDNGAYNIYVDTESGPKTFTVNKNRECSCGEEGCDHIELVKLYLLMGGIRAPDGKTEKCPVCGGMKLRDPVWGWRCSIGGNKCYLLAKDRR